MEHGRPERCMFCKEGRLLDRAEPMSFRQYTDRGYVFCRVIVPMKICDRCGARSMDERAEAIMEDAVRRAYDNLPR
jgi:hypothetical protein